MTFIMLLNVPLVVVVEAGVLELGAKVMLRTAMGKVVGSFGIEPAEKAVLTAWLR